MTKIGPTKLPCRTPVVKWTLEQISLTMDIASELVPYTTLCQCLQIDNKNNLT